MKKLIIDHYENIDPQLIQQGQDSSPWDWFRLDFYNAETDNKYMHFLKSQKLCILEEWSKLLSFAWFGGDERFLPYAETIIGIQHDIWNCFFMYFFTPEAFRGKWYGKELYNGLTDHTKQQWYKNLIYSTANTANLPIYKKRWATQKWVEIYGDETQYYFYHELT